MECFLNVYRRRKWKYLYDELLNPCVYVVGKRATTLEAPLWYAPHKDWVRIDLGKHQTTLTTNHFNIKYSVCYVEHKFGCLKRYNALWLCFELLTFSGLWALKMKKGKRALRWLKLSDLWSNREFNRPETLMKLIHVAIVFSAHGPWGQVKINILERDSILKLLDYHESGEGGKLVDAFRMSEQNRLSYR